MYDDRGQITVPDLAYLLMTFAFIGGLYPVFHTGLGENFGLMSDGTVYLFRLFLPFAILVIFTVIYVTASGGR